MRKHTVTAQDLAENETGDTVYTGPLEPAKEFIRRHEEVAETVAGGTHTVLIGTTHAPGEIVTWENADDWGRGPDNETAWRYALGAVFGPADDEFVPVDLAE